MDDKMKKEILDSWNSWKWDIWESNRSTWTSRDQAIAETISKILNDELKNTIKLVSLEGEVRMLRKELNDRKTND